jgi:hypothetical protein
VTGLGELSPNCLLWAEFLIAEVAQNFWLLFSTVTVMYYFLPKNGWATFWATFSQTHLVTLPVGTQS